MKRLICILGLILSSQCLASSSATVKINPVSGNHGYNFTVTATHNYSITNDTDTVQRYDVYFQVCAQNKGCVNNNLPVILQPHDQVKDVFTSHHYVNYARAGTYSVSGYTQIEGESNNYQNTSGTIQVY